MIDPILTSWDGPMIFCLFHLLSNTYRKFGLLYRGPYCARVESWTLEALFQS